MELMESFFKTHAYLLNHTKATVRRGLMDDIDWSHRLIGIKGTRGVGKTTFLLEYAKEKFGKYNRQCLYVNMNNFYFQGNGISDFAGEFVRKGGKVLLLDQIFKQPNWSQELRKCYDLYPELRIVFTGSCVMRLKTDYPAIKDILHFYSLRGFSFREYLNFSACTNFRPYSLDEILNNHEHIAKQVIQVVNPKKYFADYLHHGFYPFFLEQRNFSENLLKTMNMMTEVDILIIKHIELKYLAKIKKLFYLLSVEGPIAPNVSHLAQQVSTSRATVMNYMKYLADARLLNMIYSPDNDFPKKPAKVMMHNPNLMYAIYPITVVQQELMETFLVNAIWKDHVVNQGDKPHSYIIDGELRFKVCDAKSVAKTRFNKGTWYAQYNTLIGHENQIPLWLFGFLY